MRELWPTRIKPIEGDLTHKGLGLSPESRRIILSEVNVIINCAASVNFDDHLHDALAINYFGV
jgi:thioester reductase-like protein